MTARTPKDHEEHFRALMAILNGRGRSIANVVEELTGQVPSEETVSAVKNRLEMAAESGEQVDIAAVVKSLDEMALKWA